MAWQARGVDLAAPGFDIRGPPEVGQVVTGSRVRLEHGGELAANVREHPCRGTILPHEELFAFVGAATAERRHRRAAPRTTVAHLLLEVPADGVRVLKFADGAWFGYHRTSSKSEHDGWKG